MTVVCNFFRPVNRCTMFIKMNKLTLVSFGNKILANNICELIAWADLAEYYDMRNRLIKQLAFEIACGFI